MQNALWSPRGLSPLTSYLTTELNSLANAGNKLGAAIDNRKARMLYMDVEIYLAQVDLSGQTNPYVNIYLLEF